MLGRTRVALVNLAVVMKNYSKYKALKAAVEEKEKPFLDQLQQLHVRLGRSVPAIALVPAGTRGARARAPGFQMHLIKPIDGDELRAAVLEMARR